MFNTMSYDAAVKILDLAVVNPKTVRAAYLRLSKIRHPDHGGSEAEFKQLDQAYDLLKNFKPGKSNWGGMSPFRAPTRDKDILESGFVADIVAAFESMGAKCFKVHGHSMQAAGWPDLQIYHPKWTGHLEAKVDDNKYSTLQQQVMRDLRARGTAAFGIRLRDGAVLVEDEMYNVIAHIDSKSWAIKQGLHRAKMLFELCLLATAKLGADTR